MALGMYYYNARYYLPHTGRFLSAGTIVPNPQNPLSLNRFSYTRNNPVNFSDPSGHIETNCGDSVGSECGFTGNTWLIEWVPPEPDRFIGIGGSATLSIDTPVVSAGFVAGKEEIIDFQKFENTTFVYGGGSFRMGPNSGGFIEWIKRFWSDSKWDGNLFNASFSLYLLDIENVENPVTDYSGIFLSDTTTVAYEHGVIWGEAYSPRDLNRQRAHADIYGYTQGIALTKDLSVTGYVPVKTTSWFNPIPIFHNPMPALQEIWATIQEK